VGFLAASLAPFGCFSLVGLQARWSGGAAGLLIQLKLE
jgi:hypothetical protein